MNKTIRLLLIDNFDSFTFCLQHLFSLEQDVQIDVFQNNEDIISNVLDRLYDGIILGPGPGSPKDKKKFGICQWILENFKNHQTPILGICLGFQGIFTTFGGSLRTSTAPMHGKISELRIIETSSILRNIPNGSKVMRYHSILADVDSPHSSNIVLLAEVAGNSASAELNGREIMAIRHKSLPIYGLQFHPESFATAYGSQYAKNFVDIARSYDENSATKFL